MRGTDEKSGSLFSYVGLEERIPARHPLRKIRQVVKDALATPAIRNHLSVRRQALTDVVSQENILVSKTKGPSFRQFPCTLLVRCQRKLGIKVRDCGYVDRTRDMTGARAPYMLSFPPKEFVGQTIDESDCRIVESGTHV